ncbi:hypothetical protein DQ405_004845 [Pseudomonas sp. SST3]|nr:hypothetical protein [Pseudomonas sp. SST3]
MLAGSRLRTRSDDRAARQHNQKLIFQVGTCNQARFEQYGAQNNAPIEQTGTGHRSCVTQNGQGLNVLVRQYVLKQSTTRKYR